MRRHLKEHVSRGKITRSVTRVMLALIALLSATLLVLLFNVGRDVWPFWLIVHRKQIVGLIILTITTSILLSPILIEATGNTRTLSGPGRNSHGHRLDEWNDELKR